MLTTESGHLWGHPPSSVKAGSQDSTKGIINNMHESQWPQVKHFSFFQALCSEAAPFRSGLPVTQRASVGSSSASFPVWQHFRRLFPPSESDWALRTPEGLQPGWRADTHSPCKPGTARDHCRTQHPGCMRLELKTSLWNLYRWCFTRHTGVIPWWLHHLTQKNSRGLWLALLICKMEKRNPICLSSCADQMTFVLGLTQHQHGGLQGDGDHGPSSVKQARRRHWGIPLPMASLKDIWTSSSNTEPRPRREHAMWTGEPIMGPWGWHLSGNSSAGEERRGILVEGPAWQREGRINQYSWGSHRSWWQALGSDCGF